MKRSHSASLLRIFHTALEAVKGEQAVSQRLADLPLKGPVALVALGKAAQSMAEGAHKQLGEQIRRGLLVSKSGHLDLPRCAAYGWEAIEAGHPLPDAGSLQGGQRLLEFLQRPEGHESLLFLISGGASSLVEAPVAGVDLAFLQRANDWLLAGGLAIGQMNRVRKGLSRIKAGGLLQWTGERPLRVLAISDVPGDDPAVIGSGLLTPDPDLGKGLQQLALPDWLRYPLDQGIRSRQVPHSAGPEVEIVASLERAKQVAADEARALGYPVRLMDTFIEGDAAEMGRKLAAELLQGESGVTIWGGETTVRLPPQPGRGGRNQHLALAAAAVLEGHDDCWLLAAGTDGTDGPTGDAGALVDGDTLRRAEEAGMDAGRSLQAADSGRLLEASGDLIHTGPTGTNVMDLMIGLKL